LSGRPWTRLYDPETVKRKDSRMRIMDGEVLIIKAFKKPAGSDLTIL
jgi:hypothetical protein